MFYVIRNNEVALLGTKMSKKVKKKKKEKEKAIFFTSGMLP